MPFIEANQANFYYEIKGEGHPLVLIAGYSADHTNWAPVVDDLAQYFQVITFDNRGSGQTKDDGCELTAELMADDVVLIADALNLEKPHIIGSSMGGTIAQQVAIRHPDKISKLGLLVTTNFWRQRTLRSTETLIKMREADVNFDLLLDMVFSWLFGQDFLSDPEKVAFVKKLFTDNPYPQSLEDQKRQFNVLKKFNSMTEASLIEARTLVMYGDEDILSLPHESEHLASQIPNAITHEFSCAHMVCAELPEEFVKVIIEFFSA